MNKHQGDHSSRIFSGRSPHNPTGPFTASDLPLDDQGRVYHLQAKPEQIAADILLVGDPGRAEMIGREFFREVEFQHEHRGLVTVTGMAEITGKKATLISPVKATVATSGIGTPSLEIVIGELAALNEIDFQTRQRKPDFPRLHVIRVGTSGGLQPQTQLGTPIITTYAIGLDNTGLYYDIPSPDPVCQRLEGQLSQLFASAQAGDSRFQGRIQPYVSRAEPEIVAGMLQAADDLGVAVRKGLTASAPGFFAPQGRDISRLVPSLPDLDRILADFDPGIQGQRVENMEMESSFLLHFLGGLGYWAGSICPAIANRRLDTFDVDYQESVRKAIRIALLTLARLR